MSTSRSCSTLPVTTRVVRRTGHRQGCLWEPHFDFPVLSMTSQNGGADLSNHGYSPRTNLYYMPYGVAPVAHYRSAGSNGLRALGEYQTGGVFAINASTGAGRLAEPPGPRRRARPGRR